MNSFLALDFGPTMRHVYDDFLVSQPDVPVEGLFVHERRYFIVCPSLDMKVQDGRTVAEWFEHDLRPLAYPIFLVGTRPEGAEELPPCSADNVQAASGVVRTEGDGARDLAVRLPANFPLHSFRLDKRTFIVNVTRPLEDPESRLLDEAFAALGGPLSLEVRVASETEATAATPTASMGKLALVPSRFRPDLPRALRSFLEEDEAFWRDNSGRAWTGALPVEDILGQDRRSRDGSACLVATTFDPGNIRTYLSLYQRIVLDLPLQGRVEPCLAALGVTRKELLELVRLKRVLVAMPQSVERYDAALLAELVEVGPSAVTGSRRLAAAVHADQVARNPLLVVPGTGWDRRRVLRALRRLAGKPQAPTVLLEALAVGLATAWPSYENSLHVRGAMASLTGPLAAVSRELAKRLTGNDYFIEMGAAAENIEWASAFGAHYAPFESEEYSERGHCELLVALHSGVPVNTGPLARASQFKVAEDLLVIDSDVNVIDFVTDLGTGDLARFRNLVTGLARPGRSDEEAAELVSMWNRQMAAYERRPDRVKSMGLGGIVLGALSKALGAPDVVSLSALFTPMLVTLALEDWVKKSAPFGAVMDNLNAELAGVGSGGVGRVHQDAVLLARLRKVVKGMK